MKQEAENPFDSKTPEQKLHSLTAELRTPIEVIRGLAEMIKINSSANKIESEGILSEINDILKATDSIKNLLDEMVRSKEFYTPSNDLSATDILLTLRQQLLDAREQNDTKTLQNLATVFDIIWEIAAKREIEGMIFRILENLENSAYDSIGGTPWKSIIPSEEEIISALNRN